jgi:hypothetical protein
VPYVGITVAAVLSPLCAIGILGALELGQNSVCRRLTSINGFEPIGVPLWGKRRNANAARKRFDKSWLIATAKGQHHPSHRETGASRKQPLVLSGLLLELNQRTPLRASRGACIASASSTNLLEVPLDTLGRIIQGLACARTHAFAHPHTADAVPSVRRSLLARARLDAFLMYPDSIVCL